MFGVEGGGEGASQLVANAIFTASINFLWWDEKIVWERLFDNDLEENHR